MKYDFRISHEGQMFHISSSGDPADMAIHGAIAKLYPVIDVMTGSTPAELGRNEAENDNEAQRKYEEEARNARLNELEQKEAEENEVVEEPAKPTRRSRRTRKASADQAEDAPKPKRTRRTRRSAQAEPSDPQPAQPVDEDEVTPVQEEKVTPVRRRRKPKPEPEVQKYSNEELAKLASEIATVYEDGEAIIKESLADFGATLINELKDEDRMTFAKTLEEFLKDE